MRVLFLHGFLGSKEDWDEVIAHLPMECLAIDFEDILECQNCHLVGYSMGGRIALQMKAKYPMRFGKVIALSAHPGLATEDQKIKRWAVDLEWIELLKALSLEEFLKRWYAQPLFATLDTSKIMQRRLKLDKNDLIATLEKYSLSKQNFAVPHDTTFVCGSKDLKYVELYRKLLQNYQTIEGCGHALHLENPNLCAEVIRHFL